MKDIKRHLCKIFKIEKNKLNEISLEDVELEEGAQHDINSTVARMLSFNSNSFHAVVKSASHAAGVMPCTSFWVEHTKDLILYIHIGNQSRAIVVPSDSWMIRSDITIN